MTSKIKVDNIENQCGGAVVTKCGATTTISGSVVKADDIQAADGGNLINQCGTTITLGASGDTINLASGASQSGFGRTGTVDWDTTPKTASFTAVSGNGYFVNTTSGVITVTLPASPSAGAIVGFNDYARNFATNNLTVARNGSNIQGAALDGTFSTNGQSTMFVYVDGTQGWVPTEDQTTNNYGFSPLVATGGTETTCGDYKIHTFTSPGTFCVSNAGSIAKVDYLVVAGGGGGGTDGAGAGGAGGYRESKCATTSGCWTASPLATCTSLTITATAFPITVGGGGATRPSSCTGANGTPSIFSTITSTGGGGGGRTPASGNSGGSGGGPRGCAVAAGSGNTPPVAPPQGQPGGTNPTSTAGSAGGGGATVAGSSGSLPQAGPGGAGATTSISGSPTTYAGGGGGGNDQTGNFGLGGPGGGGNGGQRCGADAQVGTINTGGGGGGGGVNSPAGGAGGSGIVIIRYKFQ